MATTPLLPAKAPAKGDKWIPWYFVLFFAVLFVLDGIFVTIAILSHRGAVMDNAYQKGLRYNKTIAAADAQEALGWRGEISHAGTKDNMRLSFRLYDDTGIPIRGATVRAFLSRVLDDAYDRQLPLLETQASHYAASLRFPLSGQWHVKIYAQWQQHRYQQQQRIIIP